MKRFNAYIYKIIISSLTALICFVGPFSMHSKAASNNTGYGTFTQGSYNWIYFGAGSDLLDIGVSGMQINIRLSQVYNGVLTVTVSGITSFADYGFTVVGAQINTTSLNQIQLQLYQSQEITIKMYSSKTYNSANSITVTVSGASMSGLGTDLTSLRTISSAITNTTYGLQAIHNDLGSIEDAIDLLRTSLLPYVDDVEHLLQVGNIPVYQLNVMRWAALQGNLNFSGISPSVSIDSTSNSGNFTAARRLEIAGGATYSLIFYSTVNLNVSDLTLYTGSGYVVPTVNRNTYLTVPGYPLYLIKFNFTNPQSTFTMFEIEFANSPTLYPLFWGNSNMIPDDVSLLMGVDFNNTYTRLLQTIADGVGSLSDQTVNNTTQIINDFDSNFSTINNIESNFSLTIDNQINNTQSVIRDNNDIFLFGREFENSAAFVSDFFSASIFNTFKVPIFLILILFVVICILGV